MKNLSKFPNVIYVTTDSDGVLWAHAKEDELDNEPNGEIVAIYTLRELGEILVEKQVKIARKASKNR